MKDKLLLLPLIASCTSSLLRSSFRRCSRWTIRQFSRPNIVVPFYYITSVALIVIDVVIWKWEVSRIRNVLNNEFTLHNKTALLTTLVQCKLLTAIHNYKGLNWRVDAMSRHNLLVIVLEVSTHLSIIYPLFHVDSAVQYP
ncbi:hypothetical protein J6590_039280 [Homalodisca vitripennis]|nr:hypothetical protein J6590_039280 [Homalodisca vitripennis]